MSRFASNDGLTVRVVAALIYARNLGAAGCSSFVTATAVVGHAKGVIKRVTCTKLERTRFEGTTVGRISADIDVIPAILYVHSAGDVWIIRRLVAFREGNGTNGLVSAFAWWVLIVLTSRWADIFRFARGRFSHEAELISVTRPCRPANGRARR